MANQVLGNNFLPLFTWSVFQLHHTPIMCYSLLSRCFKDFTCLSHIEEARLRLIGARCMNQLRGASTPKLYIEKSKCRTNVAFFVLFLILLAYIFILCLFYCLLYSFFLSSFIYIFPLQWICRWKFFYYNPISYIFICEYYLVHSITCLWSTNNII